MEHDSKHLIAFVRNVKPSHQDNYHNLEMSFVYLSDSTQEIDSPYGTDPLDSLELTTMISPDGTQYGWNFRYCTIYRATLIDLEPRVALFKVVNRKLTHWAKEWGDPNTFGTYALRICKAIGAPAYLRAESGPRENAGYWQTYPLDGLVYHLDRCVSQATAAMKLVTA